MTQIKEIPDLPHELMSAIDSDSFSIFMGAGVSQLVGCWSWKHLSNELVKACYGNNYINYRQQEILLSYKDYKKVITICYNILIEKNNKKVFWKIVKKSCKGNVDKLNNKNIYKLMVKIPSLFITTNYDKHFSDLFVSDRVVFNELDMDPYLIDNEKLYHIHGHIDDQEEIVLTLPKYMGRYNNDTFKEFLSLLFGTKTILFIGYGLSEFEVLDFLFTKNKTNVKNTHFILMPYYEGDEDIVDFDQHYFNELGIKIIPYKKDELGYDQLYAILEEWVELIKSKTSYLTNSAKFIDEVVGSK